MDSELPEGFVAKAREDGSIAVTYRLFPSIVKDIFFAAVAGGAGCFLLRHDLRLALLCFALAAILLGGLWMSIRKLEFFPGDGTFSYRSGPVGGKVAAEDITSLDAVQLGKNAGSFALIATDREGRDHNLFRYLNGTEANALLEWTVRHIEAEPTFPVSEQDRDQCAAQMGGAAHRGGAEMSLDCPKCHDPITVVSRVPHGYGAGHPLLYCSRCRAYFCISVEEDAVRAEDELLIPQPPVKLRIDGRSELFSARIFHAAGLLLAPFALFWLFLTGYGICCILPGGGLPLAGALAVGGAMTLTGALLVMLAISLLANRISLEYFPATGEIVYRKGPFKWWSRKIAFKASEIAEIHGSVANAAEGDYLYTAIHFNNGRKERFLDFSQKVRAREQFEVLLRIMSVRGAAEDTPDPRSDARPV